MAWGIGGGTHMSEFARMRSSHSSVSHMSPAPPDLPQTPFEGQRRKGLPHHLQCLSDRDLSRASQTEKFPP